MGRARRILITGGTGFVGANLTRFLLAEGADVHLLVRPNARYWRLQDVRSDLRLHETAAFEEKSLEPLLKGIRPEWIFHLAAYGAYAAQADPKKIFATNLLGTTQLLQAAACVGFDAFVNAGSSSEYGLKDHACREDETPEPNSVYAVSKVAATLYGQFLARRDQLPIVTLRLYSVYGPWEEPSRLIPQLLLQGRKGLLPPLVRPEAAHDFVYVEDVVRAFVRAASCARKVGGNVYNVGTGRQKTLREVVRMMKTILPIRQRPQWGSMPSRSWDSFVWRADIRKITAELNWIPSVGFATGLKQTLKWLEAHPAILHFYENSSIREK